MTMRAFRACLLYITLAVALVPAPARAQWTEPVRISEPGGCLYPQILAQGDTLHVVYENASGYDKISYVRSTDGGETWSGHTVLSDDSCATLFPRIIGDGSDLIVLWKTDWDYGGPPTFDLGYNASTDDGITWSGPQYIFNPNWDHILYFSASGSGPVVNIVVSRRISPDLVFFSIRSTDFGQSWSGPVEIFRGVMSSLTDQVSYNNMVHFAWGGFFDWDESGDVYYLRSTNYGQTWSENIMLSEEDDKISHTPAICIDEFDDIACTWWDFKYSPYQTTGDVLIRQSFEEGEIWGREDQVTQQHQARGSDVAWLNGSLYVVWRDYRFGNVTVYYVTSSDSIHDWSNKQRLESDPAESNYPAIAASDGNVYVVWADDRCSPDTDICGGVYFTRQQIEVGIDEPMDVNVLPVEYSLDIYPNPFNSSVSISFYTAKGGHIGIAIYDVNGRLVKTLFKGGNLEKGRHRFTWDATDAEGKAVSSGLYFAVASTPQGKVSKALTLIR
jgi:hypothetical protein